MKKLLLITLTLFAFQPMIDARGGGGGGRGGGGHAGGARGGGGHSGGAHGGYHGGASRGGAGRGGYHGGANRAGSRSVSRSSSRSVSRSGYHGGYGRGGYGRGYGRGYGYGRGGWGRGWGGWGWGAWGLGVGGFLIGTALVSSLYGGMNNYPYWGYGLGYGDQLATMADDGQWQDINNMLNQRLNDLENQLAQNAQMSAEDREATNLQIKRIEAHLDAIRQGQQEQWQQREEQQMPVQETMQPQYTYQNLR